MSKWASRALLWASPSTASRLFSLATLGNNSSPHRPDPTQLTTCVTQGCHPALRGDYRERWGYNEEPAPVPVSFQPPARLPFKAPAPTNPSHALLRHAWLRNPPSTAASGQFEPISRASPERLQRLSPHGWGRGAVAREAASPPSRPPGAHPAAHPATRIHPVIPPPAGRTLSSWMTLATASTSSTGSGPSPELPEPHQRSSTLQRRL